MAEIDDLLSSTLKRVAHPGDAAGVADAIRSRVDAGDTGTPATSSGFGRRGFFRWWPWIAAVVLLLGIGGPFAAIGLIPSEDVAAPPTPAVHSSVAPSPTPSRTATPTPTPTPTETVAPEPEPAPAPAPPPVPPAPPADTTAPTISQATATPPYVFVGNGGPTDLSATVTDNVAVAYVAISWSGSATGYGSMQYSGSSWTFHYVAPPGTPAGTITFAITGVDGSGNASAPTYVNVQAIP